MFSLRDSIRRSFSKSPRHARRNTPQLKVEALETRQLLSTFALSNAGVLTQGTTVVDQNVSSFQTDGAGDLFELKTNGSLWELPSSGTWSQLDVNVGSFNVNSNGVLEEVKTNGNLWVNATPLQTGTWSKIASNVSQGGIDDLGNVYYLTSAGGFNVWTSATGSTQINPTADPVQSFQLGGTGNEQVYYQYGHDTPSNSEFYHAIYDWTDHSATNPYGINVTQTLFDNVNATGLEQSYPGGQYAVGVNGDLYVVGNAIDGATQETQLHSSTAATTTSTNFFLYVGETVTGENIPTDDTIATVLGGGKFTLVEAAIGAGTQDLAFGGDTVDNDRVLFYTPGTTPTVGSLFQAVDTKNTTDAIEINNLVGTADHEYLYFTGEDGDADYLYFDRYQIGASTPLTQLFRTATSTSGSNVALLDLQVGGDDSGYVLSLGATQTTSGFNVTTATLLGAAPGATTATPIDADVLLPTSAQTAKVLSGDPTTSTYSPYSVAPNGDVVVLETGGKLVEYNDATGITGLVLDTQGATQIGFSSSGEFFEGKSNGNLWELTVNGTWTQLDTGGLSSFGIAPNGSVYELKTNGNFWNYVGGSGTASSSIGWTKVASGVSTFLIADGQDVNLTAGGCYGSESQPLVSGDGQVGYISAGVPYLLLPSQYNVNGSFQVGTAGFSEIAFFGEYGYHANGMEFYYLGNVDDATEVFI